MHIPLVDLQAQYKLLRKDMEKTFKKIASSASFIKGPILEEFERDFAKYINVKHSIGVASGTDALHISLIALDIGKGDEVILPVNTFAATAYAILYVGAKPVFVDMNPETYNIDINAIETKITKRTKAIIPVHLYGQPVEMDKIMAIAKKFKLKIVEDAAQAHGASYNNKRVGGFGIISAFSFYPGKNLGAYGDGGAITTNSDQIAERVKKLREYGGSKYYYDEIGLNSRLDTLQAAILKIKLKHLENWNRKRQKAAAYYSKMFKENVPEIATPTTIRNTKHVYHLYVIQSPKRDELAQYLASKNIATGIHYPIPLNMQKSLQSLGYKKGEFPVAERASHNILSIPIYPEIIKPKQDYIIKSIRSFLRNNK